MKRKENEKARSEEMQKLAKDLSQILEVAERLRHHDLEYNEIPYGYCLLLEKLSKIIGILVTSTWETFWKSDNDRLRQGKILKNICNMLLDNKLKYLFQDEEFSC